MLRTKTSGTGRFPFPVLLYRVIRESVIAALITERTVSPMFALPWKLIE